MVEKTSAYEQLIQKNESRAIKIISADLDKIVFSHLGKQYEVCTCKIASEECFPPYYITNPSVLKNIYERVDMATARILSAMADILMGEIHRRKIDHKWAFNISIHQCQELKVQLIEGKIGMTVPGVRKKIDISVKVRAPKGSRTTEVIGPGLVEKSTSNGKETCIENIVLCKVNFKDIKCVNDIGKNAIWDRMLSLVDEIIESIERVDTYGGTNYGS